MTPDTDKREWLGEWIYAKFVQNYEKLLEENKNLKLIQETNEKQLKNDIKEREELREENKKLKEELKQLEERYDRNAELYKRLLEENKNLNIKVASLEWEIKWLNYTIEKLKEENQYRESIADVLPEWEGHIAEETIQDLQDRIKELIWKIDQLEEENENLRKDLFHLTNQKNNGKAK